MLVRLVFNFIVIKSLILFHSFWKRVIKILFLDLKETFGHERSCRQEALSQRRFCFIMLVNIFFIISPHNVSESGSPFLVSFPTSQ